VTASLPVGWETWTEPEKQALLDTLRAARVQRDTFGALGYTPTERQREFHDATEYDVLYGGAAGGGKSRALVADDLRDALRYPGIMIGAFRRTFDELSESLLRELRRFEYAAALGARWNDARHELRFPNRSMIRYRFLDSAEDATKRQGGEYQKITIDERGLMRPEAVEWLMERLRSGDPKIPVLGIRSGTNPGGPSHGDLKKRFIEATNYGAETYEDEQGFSVRFIPAKVSDNPHVDDAYVRRLMSIKDLARRRAMLDGDWDIFAGMFFEVWHREGHTFEPFEIPDEWTRYAGIDYGYAAPWCTLWGALDRDGRLWIYRECYELKVIESDQATRIADYESDEHIRQRFADPAMWAKTGSAPSPSQAYESVGIYLTPATNDRIPGWSRVRSWLSSYPACPIHREQGWEECPRIHISTACVNLLRTLPSMPRDPRKPEDLDTKAEDHAVDALRYLVMGADGASRPATISNATRSRIPTGPSSRNQTRVPPHLRHAGRR
jgi:hypothetical protein